MRVCLINTDFGTEIDSYILPLTMYYLAGIVRESGRVVNVVDPLLYRTGRMIEAYESVIKRVIVENDVILFTANSFGWAHVIKDIQYIRELGYKGYIVVGGIHPTAAYEHILNKYNKLVDFIVIGDGEVSLIKLLDQIEKKSSNYSIDGIAYWKDNNIIYNKNKQVVKFEEKEYIAAYDLVPLGAYDTYTLECSRGCYGNCKFCSILGKRSWRNHSIENIRNNILAIKNQAKKEKNKISIITTDDCFTSNNEWVRNVIDLFLEEEIENNKLHFEARVNQLINDEIIECIKRLKDYQIQVGVECGYDDGLLEIKKGFTIEQLIKLCNKLEEESMCQNIFFSFIIGLPHEGVKECLETIKFERFIKRRYGIKTVVNFWIPLPSECYTSLFSNNEVNYEIYDDINWQKDIDIFQKTHPRLTLKEYELLRQELKVNRF